MKIVEAISFGGEVVKIGVKETAEFKRFVVGEFDWTFADGI